MAEILKLDCALSKPQLLQVVRKAQAQLLGMHEIAKALSTSDVQFAQETFEVFAQNLDHLAADLHVALNAGQDSQRG